MLETDVTGKKTRRELEKLMAEMCVWKLWQNDALGKKSMENVRKVVRL